jgi:hypothetical protein
MKKFMDDIQFSFEPAGGTVVTMRKRVTLQPPAASQEEENER